MRPRDHEKLKQKKYFDLGDALVDKAKDDFAGAKHSIIVTGEVDYRKSRDISEQLLRFATLDPKTPIRMIIDCPCGNKFFDDTQEIISAMEKVRSLGCQVDVISGASRKTSSGEALEKAGDRCRLVSDGEIAALIRKQQGTLYF